MVLFSIEFGLKLDRRSVTVLLNDRGNELLSRSLDIQVDESEGGKKFVSSLITNWSN